MASISWRHKHGKWIQDDVGFHWRRRTTGDTPEVTRTENCNWFLSFFLITIEILTKWPIRFSLAWIFKTRTNDDYNPDCMLLEYSSYSTSVTSYSSSQFSIRIKTSMANLRPLVACASFRVLLQLSWNCSIGEMAQAPIYGALRSKGNREIIPQS